MEQLVIRRIVVVVVVVVLLQFSCSANTRFLMPYESFSTNNSRCDYAEVSIGI